MQMSNIYSKSNGYTGTIVLELLPSSSSKVVSVSKGVSASIEIAFSEKSDITTEEVEENMSRAQSCDNCLFANSSFAACPSGQKAQDSIKCVNCPFGYSGFNCSESWQLVLVIVGSVLGGLLLITLILLPVVATKTSKKSSKNDTNADTGKPYNSNRPAKAPLVNNDFAASQAHSVNGSSFTNPGVPIFPRATTTSNSRTNLEMTPSNSQQTLISTDRKSRLYDNQDDLYLYSQSRPQTRGYVQVLPQNNPYAQNQPRINPYAQSQGRTNSYYMHND
ncbi:Mucin-13 [Channa argus]|uniref:Mucin-13 n=1 Tax=Channa argus TaxID=215402 RepID=A0A6G1QPK5_CHAAH|nr:Mucin-13 [Channa argus]